MPPLTTTGGARRRRRWPRRLLLVALLTLGLYLARGRLLPAAARFLDVSEPPRPVDAVMVLGGGSSTRPFVAAALVRAGLARRALVPSVRLVPDQRDGLSPPEEQVLRRVLHVRGVPDDAVVTLPGEVASTQDEARALARYLEQEPGATVAVVTNGFHTRRARMLFRHELGERTTQVHFVAAPTDGFDEDNWWRYEGGFKCYAGEYLKLAYYGLREDHAWQIAALAALLPAGVWLARRRRRAAPLPVKEAT